MILILFSIVYVCLVLWIKISMCISIIRQNNSFTHAFPTHMLVDQGTLG